MHRFFIPFIACICRVVLVASQPMVWANGFASSRVPVDDEKYVHHGNSLSLPKTVTFNAHIRGIMSNTCYACHGPDEEKIESDLRLDSFASAVEERGVIEPGDPEESTLYQRIMDEDDPMPPEKFIHRLTEYEKALFERWIEQGAVYEQHWAYGPIRRPEIPQSELHAEKQCNPIDAFIFSRLAEADLTPAERADRFTLLRRLSLDLIGLPPTKSEMESFLNDQSDEAYQKQVDRLLASPHFGERMAAYWLDLVRFSDTVGYHGDQNQRIFPYRDFVINSLNSNQPFDEFTREQLAADLMSDATPEQLAATGLIRLNMVTREGGAQPAEYLAKYTADRVRMLGTVWLGATTGCCECHDHKYDPFSMEDFYSLGAFFDDVRQWGVYTSYQYTPNKDLSGFNNDFPFPPEMRLASSSLQRQIQFLESQLEKEASSLIDDETHRSAKFQAWQKRLVNKFAANKESDWVFPSFTVEMQNPETIEFDDDVNPRSVLFPDPPKESQIIDAYLEYEKPTWVRSVRLEVLPNPENNNRVGRSKDGNFTAKVSVSHLPQPNDQNIPAEQTMKDPVKPEKIAFAQANRSNPKRYISGRPPRYLEEGWQSGPARWQLPVDESKLPHVAVYHLNETIEVLPGQKLLVKIESNDVGQIRLSTSDLSRPVVDESAMSDSLRKFLQNSANDIDGGAAGDKAIKAAYYQFVTPYDKQDQKITLLRDKIADCRSGLAMTLVSQPVDSEKRRVSRILPRGDWQNETGTLVQPNTPHFLPGYQEKHDTQLTRLDLANWLTSPENPLTARHYVNRVWAQFFGNGLSSQLDDLGNQGEWPSHPQLLDWLASEFKSDWDRKRLIRLIVTSHVYQQQSAIGKERFRLDPYNRMLSQQSARRLEAEIVRDNALAIAGLLNTDWIGGPSVFPYQPPGYYRNLQFPNRKYTPDTDGRQYRRGLYMHWQRTFLHPMLTNFDAPARDECVARRTQSNSPQQALTLLNDPVFVEASRAFADRVILETTIEDEVRPVAKWIITAFQLAVNRTPEPMEVAGLAHMFDNQKTHFRNNPADAESIRTIGQFRRQSDGVVDPVEFAALVQVCRVILNLHETITRY